MEQLQALMRAVDRVVLTTGDLDGDSVGAMIAMWDFCRKRWPSHTVEVIIEAPLPTRYQFLVPAECSIRQLASSEDWTDPSLSSR